MSHHRSTTLSRSLSALTLAQLPPRFSSSGKPSLRRRLIILACALLIALLAISLCVKLAVRADSINPTAVVTVDAASYQSALAPNTIASAFGTQLATQTSLTYDADPGTDGIQLPTTLVGTSVEVNGVAAGLLFVSANQINYVIPANTQAGTATIVVHSGDGVISQGTASIVTAAPRLFTTSQSGSGAPVGFVTTDGTNYDLIGNVDGSTRAMQAGGILVLFGTGVRGAAQGTVHVLIGGIDAQVYYAGAQPDYIGLDQINVAVPASLQGHGVVDLVVTIGSVTSNVVNIELAGASLGAAPPTVSGFSVASALAGQTITVQGNNFSTTPSQNHVRIGSIEAQVTQATASQLTVVVPFGVAAGQVKVETSQGEGQSTGNLGIRTSISGTVQSTAGSALQGTTVRLSGTTKVAVTNDQGLFLLSDVPDGAAVVEVDGSTVAANPPYPSVTLKMVVSGNRDNQIAQPVSMQQTSGASVSVGGSSSNTTNRKRTDRKKVADAQVTSNNVTLYIPGTVTFTNGSTTGLVTLTIVDRGRLPVALPPRVFSSTIAQITPFDATFSPAADITFPNNDNIAPGTVVDLYAYDTSITPSAFTKRGTAQVSADGLTITGTGVIDRASIWLAAVPQALTTSVKGTVVNASGSAVRNARAVTRGRSAVTDGNGAFTISDVPVKAGDTLSLDVEYVTPFGRTLKTSKNVAAVPSGVTDAGQLQLPAEPALILALAPRSVSLTTGGTTTLQIASSLPAPTGGLVINLSTDQIVNLSSASVTIPEGEHTTTFDVTATGPGKASVIATTPNNPAKADATILISRPAPTLAAISPAIGPPSTQITLAGTGFSLKPRQNVVAFEQNGQITLASADDTKVLNATATPYLTTTVPPLATGSALVFVVTLDDNGVPSAASNKLGFAVTGPPQISGISPIPAEIGTEITISGTGFGSSPSDNAVLFSVPYLSVPGSAQPVFAQGKVTSATTTQLRVRVPAYAGNGPVIVVRNPVRPITQDAGLARLDKMGGSASQLFLGFAVKRASNFLAQRPVFTFGNAFENTSNMAATSTRLIAANPSSSEVLLYDISGPNAASPLAMPPLSFSQLPVEVAADSNLAIVGLVPFFNRSSSSQGTTQPGDPVAQLVDLSSGTIVGSISLGTTTAPPSNVKVALIGTTALVTADNKLCIFNVSNPTTPIPLGTLSLEGQVQALAAQGTLALASIGNQLAVIDITSPGAPMLRSMVTDFSAVDSRTLPFDFESKLYIHAVALSGTTGIISINGAVVTLDLSSPANPRVLGSAGLHFDHASFTVNGSTLIVADSVAGVMLIDISDPAQPFTVSVYDTPGGDPAVVGVASFGNYIYTNEALSFFTDDPSANNGLISTIQFAGTLSTPIPYFQVFPATPVAPGDIVTLRGFNLGDRPSDISVMFGGVTAPVLYANPTSYFPATNITEVTVQVPTNVAPTGTMLPINVQVSGASVGFNIGFDPQGNGLKRIKALSTGTPGVDAIARIGTTPYIAVASQEVGISLVNTGTNDVSGFISVGQMHAAPKMKKFGYTRIGGVDYLVVFGFNKVTQSSGLTIINVSNPAKPFVAGEFSSTAPSQSTSSSTSAMMGTFDDHITNLVLSGTAAYLNTDKLLIFDLSNPSAPTIKGSYQALDSQNIPEQISGVALYGTSTLALTTFNGTIHLLNVANPASVQLLSKFMAPPPQSTAPSASFNGPVTFINPTTVVASSEFDGQLYFVDFAAQANPVLKSKLQARAAAFAVDNVNNLLILAGQEGNPFAGSFGNGDFVVVDITDLTAPQIRSTLNTVGNGRGVVPIGTNLYVLADGTDSIIGLQLISVDPSKFPALPAGRFTTSRRR